MERSAAAYTYIQIFNSTRAPAREVEGSPTTQARPTAVQYNAEEERPQSIFIMRCDAHCSTFSYSLLMCDRVREWPFSVTLFSSEYCTGLQTRTPTTLENDVMCCAVLCCGALHVKSSARVLLLKLVRPKD